MSSSAHYRELLGGGVAEAQTEQFRARLRGSGSGGKLEEALRRYIQFSGSPGALATDLDIHANTLRYRLSRIDGLLDFI